MITQSQEARFYFAAASERAPVRVLVTLASNSSAVVRCRVGKNPYAGDLAT